MQYDELSSAVLLNICEYLDSRESILEFSKEIMQGMEEKLHRKIIESIIPFECWAGRYVEIEDWSNSEVK
jgi:hypothetical protein